MDDVPDLPITIPTVTYLREITLEGHELYLELRDAGFTDKQSTAIVAEFIIDAVNSRDDEVVEVLYDISDDEDDDDDGSSSTDDDRCGN